MEAIERVMADRRAVVVFEHLGLTARSGGQKRALRLLEAMERAGAMPHVLTRYVSDDAVEVAGGRGWEVETFPQATSAPTRRIGQYLRQEPEPANPALRRRLRELAATSAFVQFEEILAAQHLAGVPRGTPTVVSLHNVDSAIGLALARSSATLSPSTLRTRYRAHRMAAVERRSARRADAVLCVSEADRQHFAAFGADAVLVPNGVDDELFGVPETPPSEPRVLFFGAFDWEPNLLGILRFVTEGWPRVIAARPDARLRLVGPGPLDAVSAAAAGITGVEVVGFVDDLTAELSATRVVVVPIWIGGGTRIKVLEALAAARPVVGTPVGVERLGFEHDRHGLIAPTPEGLADAITALLGDEERARRYADEARRLVHDQSWSAVTRPAETLYRGWLSVAAAS
jgi:glycosyltransferase involved in cell wall biosynthesis